MFERRVSSTVMWVIILHFVTLLQAQLKILDQQGLFYFTYVSVTNSVVLSEVFYQSLLSGLEN